VMFCLVGATFHWSDFGINFFQPVFVASSNFVNLNASCGHMPFIVNPDCGRAPDPVLFFVPMAMFLIPGEMFVAAWFLRRVRARRVDISTARLWLVIVGIATAIAALEFPILMLGLWAYAGPRLIPVGPGGAYNLVIVFESVFYSVVFVGLFFFQNDKGQRVVERGMDHYSTRRRKAISLMALYTCLQLATWGPGTTPVALSSFFQNGWHKMPTYLVNGMCDAPGVTGTRYGPCPGSPGVRMPGRHSLPGRSP
jgi:hypothetical protein